jgi:hypothetical protein
MTWSAKRRAAPTSERRAVAQDQRQRRTDSGSRPQRSWRAGACQPDSILMTACKSCVRVGLQRRQATSSLIRLRPSAGSAGCCATWSGSGLGAATTCWRRGGGYVCRGEHRRLHRSACVGARRGGRRVGLPTATAGVASSAVTAAGGGYRSRAPLGWRVVPRCVCVAWRVLGARRLVAPTENLAILVQQGRPARISLVVARRGRSLGVAAEKNPTNQVEFP